MRKERHIMAALAMLAVSGHSSRRRLLAMLSSVGGLLMDARVKRGMKRCSPAQRR